MNMMKYFGHNLFCYIREGNTHFSRGQNFRCVELIESILILVKLFKIKHQGSYTISSCREIRE